MQEFESLDLRVHEYLPSDSTPAAATARPTTPDWPLLPVDAAAQVADALHQTTWDPEVLGGGISPLGGGPVDRFERDFAEYLGIPYAVSLSSGAAALHVALLASGVGEGDEVAMSAYSWPQTLLFVASIGARPILCDVSPETRCMDPGSLRKRITRRCKAIVTEHLAGCPAPVDEIGEIARTTGAALIEDCASALGARRKDQAVGTIGDFGCFSLGAKKHLPCGEGGVLVMSDRKCYENALRISQHPYRSARLTGYRGGLKAMFWPYRIHPMAAVIGSALLPYIKRWHRERRNNIALLKACSPELSASLVDASPGDEHAYGNLLVSSGEAASVVPGILCGGPVGVALHQIPGIGNMFAPRPDCPVASLLCPADRQVPGIIGWVGDQSSVISYVAGVFSEAGDARFSA